MPYTPLTTEDKKILEGLGQKYGHSLRNHLNDALKHSEQARRKEREAGNQ